MLPMKQFGEFNHSIITVTNIDHISNILVVRDVNILHFLIVKVRFEGLYNLLVDEQPQGTKRKRIDKRSDRFNIQTCANDNDQIAVLRILLPLVDIVVVDGLSVKDDVRLDVSDALFGIASFHAT